MGATGANRPYPGNTERIIERKMLYQDAFNPNPSGGGGGGGTPAAVTAWEARVIANGGADPVGSVPAATTWYNALVAAGIDTLMKDVNFFAPDSQIACLTPFFVTDTANLWTCIDIQSVTVNGLAEGVNGPVNAGGVFPSYYTTSTAGLTWYGQQPGGNALGAAQFGVGTALTRAMFQYTNQSTCYQWPANGITMANPFAANEFAFITSNRTGLGAFDVYRANGNVPFATGGNNAAASGLAPAGGTLKTGSLAGNPFFYNFSATYVHSFFAAHLGLTSAQAQALFNATQALRQAFGGGFT